MWAEKQESQIATVFLLYFRFSKPPQEAESFQNRKSFVQEKKSPSPVDKVFIANQAHGKGS
tara:strand:+ start:731 stop:913 length:183 start_codon:yes stop_codon:yes gene_type:complete